METILIFTLKYYPQEDMWDLHFGDRDFTEMSDSEILTVLFQSCRHAVMSRKG